MSKSNEIYLIALNIRSALNVGSLFRSADAFGVKKIYLCGITAKPPDKQLAKTALGAEKSIEWEYCAQISPLLERLKKPLDKLGASGKINLVALELTRNSTPLNKFKPKFPLALIVGHETRGVSVSVLKMCDEVVSIPMSGVKESLNVAVAAGVALYELRNQNYELRNMASTRLDSPSRRGGRRNSDFVFRNSDLARNLHQNPPQLF